MSVTANLTRKFNDGVSDLGSTPLTVTSGSLVKISEDIPANQTNLPVACAFANAKLKALFIIATAAMTVYTNDVSGGSPQETIHLIANVPYCWALGGSCIGSDASPLAGNVTGLYVTNTTAGTLDVRAVVDPT